MGVLICIEGIDGSGKSTVIESFRRLLDKDNTSNAVIHFPNEQSYYGKIIYDHLNGKREIPSDIFQGLYTLDMYSNQELIKEMLSSYDVVILDRWFYSTLAYAKYYSTQEIVESVINGLLKPDLAFLIDGSAGTAINRLDGKDKDKHEVNSNLLYIVAQAYRDMADEYGMVIIAGDLKVNQTVNRIYTRYTDLKEKDKHIIAPTLELGCRTCDHGQNGGCYYSSGIELACKRNGYSRWKQIGLKDY